MTATDRKSNLERLNELYEYMASLGWEVYERGYEGNFRWDWSCPERGHENSLLEGEEDGDIVLRYERQGRYNPRDIQWSIGSAAEIINYILKEQP